MKFFFFGALGAILPDVLLFESKRFTAPLLTFDLPQYCIVRVLYMLSAGIVASVIPLPGGTTPWKAILVGVTLPAIISASTAAADRLPRPAGEQLVLRGAPVGEEKADIGKMPGNIIDLMAVF